MANRRFSLYIDESGTASIGQKLGRRERSKFFVLVGVIIENHTDAEIAGYLNFIKRRYKYPPDGESFHAGHFFEHRGSVSTAIACKVSESLAEFITNAPIKIKVVALDKNQLRKALGAPANYGFKGSKEHKEDKEVGYEILARELFFWFARYLKSKNAIGSVIAESRRNPDVVLFKTFLASQEPNNFLGRKLLNSWSHLARKHIVSIAFETKRGVKAGLEIADLSSYIAHLYLRNEMEAFSSRGTKTIWKSLKRKVEDKNIKILKESGFHSVAPDRMHKIANKIKEKVDSVFDDE